MPFIAFTLDLHTLTITLTLVIYLITLFAIAYVYYVINDMRIDMFHVTCYLCAENTRLTRRLERFQRRAREGGRIKKI
jgi:hypothetical protein